MIITKIQAGLGNQLFQYASGRALSLFLDADLKFDLSFYNEAKNKNAYRLNRFNLNVTDANVNEFAFLKNENNIPKLISIIKRLGFGIYPYYQKTHII